MLVLSLLAPIAGNVGIGLSSFATMGSKLQINGNAAIGYSASTAAPTNGLAVAGNSTFAGSILSTVNAVSFAFASAGASYAQLFQSTSTGYTLGYGASATTIGTAVLTWTSNNNNVGIGTINPVATAALQISSTTQGFLPPVMTTTQKNAITSPATGLVVFDSTLGKLCVFSGTWQTITSI
jgi:hypothetical protein